MMTPFVAHNAVVFECRSGVLCVGDLVNAPARYTIDVRGICHLPARGIIPAVDSASSFAVDNGQIFFIDSDHYKTIAAAIVDGGNIAPNYDLFASLRAQHETQFGYVAAGDLFDSAFNGDGTYALDLTLLRGGVPEVSQQPAADARELLRRVVSGMNTLVCAACFVAEIGSHPELGAPPRGRGKKKREWSQAMADHALASGWNAIPEPGSFGDITPLCPACNAQRES